MIAALVTVSAIASLPCSSQHSPVASSGPEPGFERAHVLALVDRTAIAEDGVVRLRRSRCRRSTAAIHFSALSGSSNSYRLSRVGRPCRRARRQSIFPVIGRPHWLRRRRSARARPGRPPFHTAYGRLLGRGGARNRGEGLKKPPPSGAKQASKQNQDS
jgi:hypothetical protein